VIRIWPNKSDLVLHQLVELYGAHDCAQAQSQTNKCSNIQYNQNEKKQEGNELFFNKDLLDII